MTYVTGVWSGVNSFQQICLLGSRLTRSLQESQLKSGLKLLWLMGEAEDLGGSGEHHCTVCTVTSRGRWCLSERWRLQLLRLQKFLFR